MDVNTACSTAADTFLPTADLSLTPSKLGTCWPMTSATRVLGGTGAAGFFAGGGLDTEANALTSTERLRVEPEC